MRVIQYCLCEQQHRITLLLRVTSLELLTRTYFGLRFLLNGYRTCTCNTAKDSLSSAKRVIFKAFLSEHQEIPWMQIYN